MALPGSWNRLVIFDDYVSYPQGQPVLGAGIYRGHRTRRFIASGLSASPSEQPFTVAPAAGSFEGETITTGHWEVEVPLSEDPDVDGSDSWTFTLTLQGVGTLTYDVDLVADMAPRVRLSDVVNGTWQRPLRLQAYGNTFGTGTATALGPPRRTASTSGGGTVSTVRTPGSSASASTSGTGGVTTAGTNTARGMTAGMTSGM